VNEKTAAVVSGSYVDPKTARMTVGEWCATWLEGYSTRRASSVRQARVHLTLIIAEFGAMRLDAVRPSQVRSWTAKLRAAGYAPSTVYAVHARLAQVMSDAVHDGLLMRSPCSRRTSPGAGRQRPYVATTEQVWALHDRFPEHLRVAVLLGAFVGLRTAEVCGLRLEDVDVSRGGGESDGAVASGGAEVRDVEDGAAGPAGAGDAAVGLRGGLRFQLPSD
jgi:integrase